MFKQEMFNRILQVTKHLNWSDTNVPEQIKALFLSFIVLCDEEEDSHLCNLLFWEMHRNLFRGDNPEMSLEDFTSIVVNKEGQGSLK